MFPKMSARRRNVDETKYMSFLIKDNELLEKCKKIWHKVSIIIIKTFDCKAVCCEKYLKTKTKSYERKIDTNLQNEKMPKEHSQCICILVALIESFLKNG